jgi:hypothetical protein
MHFETAVYTVGCWVRTYLVLFHVRKLSTKCVLDDYLVRPLVQLFRYLNSRYVVAYLRYPVVVAGLADEDTVARLMGAILSVRTHDG